MPFSLSKCKRFYVEMSTVQATLQALFIGPVMSFFISGVEMTAGTANSRQDVLCKIS